MNPLRTIAAMLGASAPDGEPARMEAANDGVDLHRAVLIAAVPLIAAFAAVLALNLVAIAANPWNFPLGRARATIAFEGGPWTWLSVVLLVGTAAVIFFGTRHRGDRRWWSATALLFVYFAIDEGFVIHERFDDWLGIDSIDHYGWTIPGVVVVAGVGLVFARWFFSLPWVERRRLLVAGLAYVGGGLGVEVIAGMWQTAHAEDRIFFLVTTVEEVLEVIGPFLVIRTVLLFAPRPPRRRAPAGA